MYVYLSFLNSNVGDTNETYYNFSTVNAFKKNYAGAGNEKRCSTAHCDVPEKGSVKEGIPMVFSIMMIYEGPEVFSLCGDVRRIIPELSMADTKLLLLGELTTNVN